MSRSALPIPALPRPKPRPKPKCSMSRSSSIGARPLHAQQCMIVARASDYQASRGLGAPEAPRCRFADSSISAKARLSPYRCAVLASATPSRPDVAPHTRVGVAVDALERRIARNSPARGSGADVHVARRDFPPRRRRCAHGGGGIAFRPFHPERGARPELGRFLPSCPPACAVMPDRHRARTRRVMSCSRPAWLGHPRTVATVRRRCRSAIRTVRYTGGQPVRFRAARWPVRARFDSGRVM